MQLRDSFIYTHDTDNPAVLGVIEGPCADISIPTRNGRFYCEKLWDKVFNDELIKECFENGGIFGEAQHPLDREETDTEKIAIAMKEPPIKKKDGSLWGRFYILNTPCGKILKVLADFGYKIGISSRGTGDVVENYDGSSSVDPDTYDFKCFDAVLTPALKAARTTLVTEGLDNKSLSTMLTESLNTANEHDRQIMKEALNEMEITYNDSGSKDSPENSETSSNEGVNDTLVLTEDLKKTLRENAQLNQKILSLQEKLSVSNAKENELQESMLKLRHVVAELSTAVKSKKVLAEKLASTEKDLKNLQEKLECADKTIKSKEKLIESLYSKNSSLVDASKRQSIQYKKDIRRCNSLEEAFNNDIKSAQKENENLKLQIQELQEQLKAQKCSSVTQLNEARKLSERYKKLTKNAVDRYIECKASNIGVDASEIKSKLSDGYTFANIDSVCEDLKKYKVNVNKLPFLIQEDLNLVNGGIQVQDPTNYSIDDDVEDLLTMIDL